MNTTRPADYDRQASHYYGRRINNITNGYTELEKA
jgi:hypothetical protein